MNPSWFLVSKLFQFLWWFFGFFKVIDGFIESFIGILGQKLVEKQVLGQENLISDFVSTKVAGI